MEIEAIVTLILAQRWLALGSLAIGAAVRVAKMPAVQARIPLPPRYRPLLALALGVGQGVLEALVIGSPWAPALVRGVLAAGVSMCGHDLLIEGLRGGRELGRPRLARAPGTVAMLVLCVSLAGCAHLGAALSALGQGGQYIGALVDVAEAGSRAYLARHPSATAEYQVDAALRRARLAVATLDGAVSAAQAGEAGDVDAARREALEAYDALRTLLDGIGVLSGSPQLGGAETDAPAPEPVTLPSADEIGRRLGRWEP